MLGRACCTNWQDTFIQTNVDVIARWVRVITLAKGRHFLNLLVLHRFRVSSKSYKLAPRIGTRVQCLSNDPSVAFSHSFTSSSASHVVAYEIRQAGYPLCSVVVSDYFPSKITMKKPCLKGCFVFRTASVLHGNISPKFGRLPVLSPTSDRQIWPILACFLNLFEGLKGEHKFPRRIGHDSATVDGRDPAPGAQCPMRVSIAN